MKKRNLQNNIFLVSFFSIFLLCGCADKVTQESKIYTKEELAFIEAYNKLEKNNIKMNEYSIASDEPKSTDFAIVPLEEKYFQVPAFSFLPIQDRELTQIELIQLYNYYGEIEAEKILENRASMARNSAQRSNRNLSEAEHFKLRYEILEQYFNQKKRPKKEISVNGENGNPFYRMLSETERFWFYPTEELNEEQILQILDSMYAHVPQEWYTPEKDELSFKDIENKVQNLLEKYTSTNKKANKSYIFYVSATPMNEGLPESMQSFKNCFELSVNMKNSEFDYTLTISAEDGNLMKWKRYPKNYFSQEYYNSDKRIIDNLSKKENGILLSEEQLKNIALEYAEKILLLKKEEILARNIVIEKNQNTDLNYEKITISRSNMEYNIFINKEDGKICGLEIN